MPSLNATDVLHLLTEGGTPIFVGVYLLYQGQQTLIAIQALLVQHDAVTRQVLDACVKNIAR